LIVLFNEAKEDPRRRRDRLEIITVMLKFARVSAPKTQMMSEAGLSSLQLTEYLSYLVRLGLLEASKENGRLTYETTAKGKRIVKAYKEIKHLLRESSEHSPQCSY
jgi:predicted transcriptional regulator